MSQKVLAWVESLIKWLSVINYATTKCFTKETFIRYYL